MEKRNISMLRFLGLMIAVCVLAGSALGQSTRDSTGTVAFTENVSNARVSQDSNPPITLELDQVPLKEALKRIADQAKAGLYYNATLLPEKIVSLHLKAVPLGTALRKVLEGTSLKVVTSGRNITLRPKSTTDQGQAPLARVQESITGTVTDGSTGNTLPGVNIKVKGTTTGTATGPNGQYELSVESLQDTLVFSFVGYRTQEVPINGRTEIDVEMQTQAITGQEMVVVGYGEAKKETLTGSITSKEGDVIERAPVTNVSHSLAGRLPGLTVVSRSGQPGSDDPILRIRGQGTLGDNSPLVVVDGFKNRSLSRLNPEDIKSITVLKDASAAIYGSQAANGVILVETKRGVTGKPKVTLTYNQGISKPTVLPKMADAATYAQIVNEINGYRNNPPKYTQEEIQKYRADDSDPWQYPNTDWFNAVYKPFSLQQYANASVRGGSKYIKYWTSLGTKYQDGNYRNSATNYSQVNFRSNIGAKISKNINLSINIAGRQENRNYPTKSADVIFISAIKSYPTTPARWPNGKVGPAIERGENPVAMATNATGHDKDRRYIIQSNAKLDINIPSVKGLMVTGNISFDKNIRNDELWQTPWTLYTWDHKTYDSNNEPVLTKGSRGYSEPRLTETSENGKRIVERATINYKRNFLDNHNINFLAGIEKHEDNTEWFNAFRRYYISEVNQELSAGGENEKDNDGSSGTKRRLNYFGRINYNFRSKYLAEFLWRYDGSYIFAKDGRFGFFPGVSVGWRISEEDFWNEHIQSINEFKLRASWGKTGNDRIEPYQFLSSYGFGNLYIFNEDTEVKTTHELRIPNPKITWEVANQSDIGIDLKMFNSKLSFTADYFRNLRNNILWKRNASVPSTTGFSLPKENIGKVINQGLDFNLAYNNRRGDFNYRISINGGYSKNRVKFIDETPGVPEYQRATGNPMNSPLLYKAIGIFHNQKEIEAYPHWSNARPGDIKFKDVNNDNKINGLDKLRIPKNDLPTFTGGLNINLEYKDISFGIFAQGAAGATTYHFTDSGLFGNYLQMDAEGRWTKGNPDATKPRAWNVRDEYWMKADNQNTYFLRSTNYIRIKTVNIGYTIPKYLTTQWGIGNLRIYLSGQNVFTIDKLENYDPETNDWHGYPPVKVYNAGLKITF